MAATTKTGSQLVPHSPGNYAFSQGGKVNLSTPTDYVYLIDLYFGCTVNGSSSTQVASACNLNVQGWCLPTGFPDYVGGELAQLNWTFKSTPRLSRSKTANLTYASPYLSKTTFDGTSKTKRPVLCTNYTLTATTQDGSRAALYLDDVNLALYTSNDD